MKHEPVFQAIGTILKEERGRTDAQVEAAKADILKAIAERVGAIELVPGPKGDPGAEGKAADPMEVAKALLADDDFLDRIKGEPGAPADPADVAEHLIQSEAFLSATKGDAGAPGAHGEKGRDGKDVDQEQVILRLKNDHELRTQIKGDKGDPGDRGEKGEPGLRGEKGDPGLSGEKGDPGDPGPKGDQGLDADPEAVSKALAADEDFRLSVRGEKGDPGLSGEKGDPGEPGPKGDQGLDADPEAVSKALAADEDFRLSVRGEKGDPGLRGEKGEPGSVGEKGEPGERGERGDPGEAGKSVEADEVVKALADDAEFLARARGEKGDPGPIGEKGLTGDKGDPGERGEKGDPGDPGPIGEKGLTGDKGDPGERGEKGEDGADAPIVDPTFEVKAGAQVGKGRLGTHNGGLWQAVRKTSGDPSEDPNSWRLVVDGVEGIASKYVHVDRKHVVSIRKASGEVYRVDLDAVPGFQPPEEGVRQLVGDFYIDGGEEDWTFKLFDGDDWQERKLVGPQGVRGRKGAKGEDGLGIRSVKSSGTVLNGLFLHVTYTNGQVEKLPLDFDFAVIKDFVSEWLETLSVEVDGEIKRFAGPWRYDTRYSLGDVVNYNSSLFLYLRASSDQPGSSDATTCMVTPGGGPGGGSAVSGIDVHLVADGSALTASLATAAQKDFAFQRDTGQLFLKDAGVWKPIGTPQTSVVHVTPTDKALPQLLASTSKGDLAFVEDTKTFLIHDGGAWNPVGGAPTQVPSGVHVVPTDKPLPTLLGTTTKGDLAFVEDTATLMIHDGGAWVPLGGGAGVSVVADHAAVVAIQNPNPGDLAWDVGDHRMFINTAAGWVQTHPKVWNVADDKDKRAVVTKAVEGDLAYQESDTTFWLHHGGAWVSLSSQTAIEVVDDEAALGALQNPVEGDTAYQRDTHMVHVFTNGAWSPGNVAPNDRRVYNRSVGTIAKRDALKFPLDVQHGSMVQVQETGKLYMFDTTQAAVGKNHSGRWVDVLDLNPTTATLLTLTSDPEKPIGDQVEWQDDRLRMESVAHTIDLNDRKALPQSHLQVGKLIYDNETGQIFKFIGDPAKATHTTMADWEPLSSAMLFVDHEGDLPDPFTTRIVDGQPFVIRYDASDNDLMRLVAWDGNVPAKIVTPPSALTVLPAVLPSNGVGDSQAIPIDVDAKNGVLNADADYNLEVDYTFGAQQHTTTVTFPGKSGMKAYDIAAGLAAQLRTIQGIDATPSRSGTAATVFVTTDAGRAATAQQQLDGQGFLGVATTQAEANAFFNQAALKDGDYFYNNSVGNFTGPNGISVFPNACAVYSLQARQWLVSAGGMRLQPRPDNSIHGSVAENGATNQAELDAFAQRAFPGPDAHYSINASGGDLTLPDGTTLPPDYAAISHNGQIYVATDPSPLIPGDPANSVIAPKVERYGPYPGTTVPPTVTVPALAAVPHAEVASMTYTVTNVGPTQHPKAGGWQYLNREIWQKDMRADADQASAERMGDLQITKEADHVELKIWDGKAWVLIHSDDQIKAWIAALSLFEGTTQETGGGAVGAIDMAGLPDLEAMTASGDLSLVSHYWTFIGTPNYEVKNHATVSAEPNYHDITNTIAPALPAGDGAPVTLDLGSGGNPIGVDRSVAFTVQTDRGAETVAVQALAADTASEVAHKLELAWPAAGNTGITVTRAGGALTLTPAADEHVVTLRFIGDGSTPNIGTDLTGAVLNPGDWLQIANVGGDGSGVGAHGGPVKLQWVTVGGDLLAKSRADRLFGLQGWQAGGWEQGSVVSAGGNLYRASRPVTGADPRPDEDGLHVTGVVPQANVGHELNSFDPDFTPNPPAGFWEEVAEDNIQINFPGGTPFSKEYVGIGERFLWTGDATFTGPVAGGLEADQGWIRYTAAQVAAAWPAGIADFATIASGPGSSNPWHLVPVSGGVKSVGADNQLPATAPSGEIWLVEQSARGGGGPTLFNFDSGARSWLMLGASNFSFGTSFPAGAASGNMFYRTDQRILYYYDGTLWQQITRSFTGGKAAATADVGPVVAAADSGLEEFTAGLTYFEDSVVRVGFNVYRATKATDVDPEHQGSVTLPAAPTKAADWGAPADVNFAGLQAGQYAEITANFTIPAVGGPWQGHFTQIGDRYLYTGQPLPGAHHTATGLQVDVGYALYPAGEPMMAGTQFYYRGDDWEYIGSLNGLTEWHARSWPLNAIVWHNGSLWKALGTVYGEPGVAQGWERVVSGAGAPFTVATTAPATPARGGAWLDTSAGAAAKIYDGTNWQTVGPSYVDHREAATSQSLISLGGVSTRVVRLGGYVKPDSNVVLQMIGQVNGNWIDWVNCLDVLSRVSLSNNALTFEKSAATVGWSSAGAALMHPALLKAGSICYVEATIRHLTDCFIFSVKTFGTQSLTGDYPVHSEVMGRLPAAAADKLTSWGLKTDGAQSEFEVHLEIQ